MSSTGAPRTRDVDPSRSSRKTPYDTGRAVPGRHIMIVHEDDTEVVFEPKQLEDTHKKKNDASSLHPAL